MASRLQALGLVVVPPDLVPDELRMINPGLIYWTYPSKDGEAAKAAGVVRP
jgi:hypothetical protein